LEEAKETLTNEIDLNKATNIDLEGAKSDFVNKERENNSLVKQNKRLRNDIAMEKKAHNEPLHLLDHHRDGIEK